MCVLAFRACSFVQVRGRSRHTWHGDAADGNQFEPVSTRGHMSGYGHMSGCFLHRVVGLRCPLTCTSWMCSGMNPEVCDCRGLWKHGDM